MPSSPLQSGLDDFCLGSVSKVDEPLSKGPLDLIFRQSVQNPKRKIIIVKLVILILQGVVLNKSVN